MQRFLCFGTLRNIPSLIFVLILSLQMTWAQSRIQGKITDAAGISLPGANIMIKGSFEGATADTSGKYQLRTSITGSQILVVRYIGYITLEKTVILDGKPLIADFILKEDKSRIGDVVITAGMFQTADQKKSVTLQPLDIVTTPSSVGDIYGALTSLPGASVVGEDGRLFVRGGDGYESKTFIDGLLVKKPYTSSAPDLPSRGRFSPFLFSGTTFSTGGYSAEYGQALSSALILTTNSFPEKTQTEIMLMTMGLDVTQTFRSDRKSVSAGFEYFNMQPYYSVVNQNIHWYEYPSGSSGTLSARFRTGKEGLLKVFSTLQVRNCAMLYPEMTTPGSMQDISLKSLNQYTNVNFTGPAGKGWIVKTGISFTYDSDKKTFRLFDVTEKVNNAQTRLVLKKKFNERASLSFGWEEVYNYFEQRYTEHLTEFLNVSEFRDFNTAMFAEGDVKAFPWLAVRAGIRNDYSSILDKNALAFRGSLAWPVVRNVQASVAYGSFFQTPEESLLRFTHRLNYERADHYILNIQYEANDRILRFEGYYKKYSDLVVFDPDLYYDPALYHNNGYGYSRGIDVFFRDRKSIKNLDYWVSYSLLDAKRYYRDFPYEAKPTFAARNNLSIVAKEYVTAITTQFGAVFTWSDGRPYNDPNEEKFMHKVTGNYADLSVNISYLTKFFGKPAILYSSLSNIFGKQNIYGYRYYETPDAEGIYKSVPVTSESRRFFMIAFIVTI